jgi:hypothetical protein
VLLWILRWVPRPIPNLRLFFMFSLGNVLNLGGIFVLAWEQHTSNFLAHYRHGAYVRCVEMARIVRERVPEDAVVVGPYANVLTYLSGRNVLSGKLMGFDLAGVTKYPALAAAHHPTFLIGPHTEYAEKDRPVGSLISRGVIRPLKLVDRYIENPGKKDEHILWLATAEVVVPATDWRKLPTTRPIVMSDRANRVAARQSITPEEAAKRELKAARERKRIRAEREERKQRNARKLRRQQQQQKAATQPAAPGAAPAATQPSSTSPASPAGSPPATQPVGMIDETWRVRLATLGGFTWTTEAPR